MLTVILRALAVVAICGIAYVDSVASVLFEFKGLGPGTSVAELEEGGLIECRTAVPNGRTALCSAREKFYDSNYGTFVGKPIRFALFHALDGKIVRLFIAPKTWEIEETLPNIIQALERKFGEPAQRFERYSKNFKTDVWTARAYDLPSGKPFYPILWKRDGVMMMLGNALPSFQTKIYGDHVLDIYTFKATNDTMNTMHPSLALLIVSDNYLKALRIYEEEKASERERRQNADRQYESNDI
ncbi:MAG: hypothetical protein WD672_06185 [Woeseia sp.]